MTVELVVMWIVVGLLAGWVAGHVMKEGGYGLKGDLLLGVVGSIVGGWLFSVSRISPEAGLAALTIIAFIAGIAMIFAQHRLWPMHA